jgi:hypothetical protein
MRAAAALLLLAGCGEAGDAPQTPAPNTCNAAAYAALIGQDKAQATMLPAPKWTYRLGQPVTMDFIAERLNIKLDEADTIIAIDCG